MFSVRIWIVLEYSDRNYTSSGHLKATKYKTAQNAGNTQSGGSGGTRVTSSDDYYVDLH